MRILIMALCLPILTFSQAKLDPETSTIYLKEIHQIEGDAGNLKKKASQWVATSYNNSNYVTRLNESDNIIIKGSFDCGATMTNYGTSVFLNKNVSYTLDLAFKDGRYKIEIKNVNFDDTEAGDALSMYLMEKEEMREYLLAFYETYEGPGKKMAIKNAQNDKKFDKYYQGMHNYGLELLPQIYANLNAIDASLLAHMNSSSEDDW